MGGLHTHMGIGGVALARPTATKIYFPFGDAVALRF